MVQTNDLRLILTSEDGKRQEYPIIETAREKTGRLMEIAELPREAHPFFLGTQFHPEFSARPLALRGGDASKLSVDIVSGTTPLKSILYGHRNLQSQ